MAFEKYEIDNLGKVAIFREKNQQIEMTEKVIIELSGLLGIQAEVEKRMKQIREAIQESMEKHEIKKFENENLSIVYTPAGVSNRLNQKKLKELYEEAYIECMEQSETKAKITIKEK